MTHSTAKIKECRGNVISITPVNVWEAGTMLRLATSQKNSSLGQVCGSQVFRKGNVLLYHKLYCQDSNLRCYRAIIQCILHDTMLHLTLLLIDYSKRYNKWQICIFSLSTRRAMVHDKSYISRIFIYASLLLLFTSYTDLTQHSHFCSPCFITRKFLHFYVTLLTFDPLFSFKKSKESWGYIVNSCCF